MPDTCALTAPNLFIDGENGIRYAYRRFGAPRPSTVPLILLQHFRGKLDNWDPAFVGPIAEEREVILLDNEGVGGSSGTAPSTVAEMATGALAFIDALRLNTYDLLGFSLGGFAAQEIALTRPHQVRRMILTGSDSEGGRGFHHVTGEVGETARRDEPGAEDLLTLFLEHFQAASQEKEGEFVRRLFTRHNDREEPTDLATRHTQLAAVSRCCIPDNSRLGRLAAIKQPALAANGNHDVMTPTENTYLLGGHLPNAQVAIYPDVGHGFLFQHPSEFSAEVNSFLDA
ncbi:alpha/beta fold hydrolase [Streptomyces sp. NPDC088400]|uniref:alpha/beta fold hydrolase n=1 Tax=Streptomyces sp. NPDC088400 TaxID=3365861 RepID=UPI00381539A6